MANSRTGLEAHVELFLRRRWHVYFLDGQDDPFVWDSASNYLAKVPVGAFKRLAEPGMEQTSLKEALQLCLKPR